MKIILSPEQRKHFKSLTWLFLGPRQSGRTTLLAHVLIDVVMVSGQRVRIIDHHPTKEADRHLARLIDTIIEVNKLPLRISNTGDFIELKK